MAGEWMLSGWKRTQKNQASRMYPGTSQANFLRFSSLSHTLMMVMMVVDNLRKVTKLSSELFYVNW
jgi:hypothetical protein